MGSELTTEIILAPLAARLRCRQPSLTFGTIVGDLNPGPFAYAASAVTAEPSNSVKKKVFKPKSFLLKESFLTQNRAS